MCLQVWNRWADGPDTCVSATQLPLSRLTQLQPGPPVTLSLPMALDSDACEARATAPGADMPVMQVRLQAEQAVVGPAAVSDDATGIADNATASTPSPEQPLAPPDPSSIVLPASIHVDITAGCGLQTAVSEAAAWLGGAASVLGRAHQLGPHPYATLSLFPADEHLKALYPAARTPFQVSHNGKCSMRAQPLS